MQFSSPSVLWALWALTIPLIIHLFNFRKTKKVYFTNVAFLRKVQTETSSFRQLKQWLIMLARMLFLAALILAFAQPFIPAKNSQELNSTSKGINAFYLDNSLSMQNTSDNKRYIDLAVIKIDELLALFQNQSNIQLSSNDFSGEDQFANNAAKVRDRLTEINFSPNARSLSSVYNRQANMAKKENYAGNNNFFWFSDFQKSTTGNLNTLEIDSTDQIYLVPVQGVTSKNVFVDSIWVSTPFLREMQNAVLYVKVFNSGNESVENLPIKLIIDGVQTSTTSVSISPEGYGTASFNFTVREKGEHRGLVSFDDQPIAFDNEQYFVINVSPPVNVLHLYQSKSEHEYIAKLYANDSLFNFEQFNVRNVDLTRLTQSDVVVLEGVSNIDENLKNTLIPFVENGGSLLLIPSESPDLSSYQTLLSNFGINTLDMLVDSASIGKRIEFETPDKNNPFFTDVFEQSNSPAILNLPSAQVVLRWTGLGQRLLNLRNGASFLSQTSFMKGSVYLMASPLNTSHGNFAEHALFVPTFFKIAALSVKPQRLAYRFSESTMIIPFPNAPRNAIYTLKNGDFEILPIQRMQGNNLLLELPSSADLAENQIFESGFYDLQIDGIHQKVLALNHDSKESRMGTYSVEELRDIFSEKANITIFDNIQDGDFIRTFAEQNFGKQLWKYFLYAALFFLMLEILLLRFLKG